MITSQEDREANALIEQFLNGSEPKTEKKSYLKDIKEAVNKHIVGTKTTKTPRVGIEEIIKDAENTSIENLKNICTGMDADLAIENHIENKKYTRELETIASKGARVVLSEVNSDRGSNRSIQLINIFDTRGMDAVDFTMYLSELIYHKAYDKISLYINWMRHDYKQDVAMNYFFINGIFSNLKFRNSEEKAYVRELLKMDYKI